MTFRYRGDFQAVLKFVQLVVSEADGFVCMYWRCVTTMTFRCNGAVHRGDLQAVISKPRPIQHNPGTNTSHLRATVRVRLVTQAVTVTVPVTRNPHHCDTGTPY